MAAELPFTFFASRAAAQDVADRNSENDATWAFAVEAVGKFFVIVVSDEDGVPLGRL